MIINTKIARFLLIVLMLLFAIEGYGKEADVEIDTNAIPVNDLDPSDDSATLDPSSGTETHTKSSMFFPIDKLESEIDQIGLHNPVNLQGIILAFSS